MLKRSQTHSELLLIKEKGTAKSDERSVGLSDNGDIDLAQHVTGGHGCFTETETVTFSSKTYSLHNFSKTAYFVK